MPTVRPGEPTAVAVIVPGKPVVGRPVVVAGTPIAYTVNKEGLRVWSGEGPPPPEPPLGIAVGDTYVDTITGQVYRLDPGE